MPEQIVPDPGRRHASSGSPYEGRVGFSRAVRAGPMTAVAGTAPMNPDGSSADGDAGDQMRRCLEIIEAALRDLDVPLNHVVRTRTYLVDPSDEPQVAQVHGEFFGGIRPASTMVVVKSLLRPEWRVEVEADAYSPDA